MQAGKLMTFFSFSIFFVYFYPLYEHVKRFVGYFPAQSFQSKILTAQRNPLLECMQPESLQFKLLGESLQVHLTQMASSTGQCSAAQLFQGDNLFLLSLQTRFNPGCLATRRGRPH